ncbi:MAG: hypothetical protein KGL25_03605, partial [Gammaproteobacteria bacterium]|nr:hypothetical protein [Gammaproteobacteria bacterium]
GESIRNLQHPAIRWQRTLGRLNNIRYRRPYVARHTSVSWDLMIGRSALWVARQHGHSISTMLRFYAAWAEGALESDVERIRATLNSELPVRRAPTLIRGQPRSRPIVRPFEIELPTAPTRFATGFATNRGGPAAKSLKGREKTGGERGIHTGS